MTSSFFPVPAAEALETPQPAAGEFRYPDAFPRLETPRLILRAPRADDADRIWDLYSDPRVTQYDDSDPYTDRAQAGRCIEATLQAFENRNQIRFVIADRTDDRLIGTVGIYGFDDEALRGELGYDLLFSRWNQGYATEAVRAVCSWAFAYLGLYRIEAQVSPGNAGSCRLLQKCGFTYEGHLRNRDYFRGRWWDSLMHSLLRPAGDLGAEVPVPGPFRIEAVEEPSAKESVCTRILAELPLWFGIPEATREYCEGVRAHRFLAAWDGGTAAGFVSVRVNNPQTAEVYVMGIRPEHHRRGLGSLLLEAVRTELRREGFRYLLVKTLDESRESEEYRRTRLFYRKNGFVPLDVLRHEWGPENPCLVMVASLDSGPGF